MAADLDQILTGVTARRPEDGEKNLVEHCTILFDPAPLHATGRTLGKRSPTAKDPPGNLQRTRSTDPYNRQGAGTNRGSEGGNGVRTGHQRTATKAPRSTAPSASS